MKYIRNSVILLAILLLYTLSVVYAFQYFFTTDKQQISSGLIITSRTIIVPDDYPTIQEAINAANSGDIVFVRAGTYYEHVVVNKSVSLIGESVHDTIIDGNGLGSVITVTVDYVNISNFTIQKSGITYPNSGIYIRSTRNCTIRQNKLVDNYYGILLELSHGCIIGKNVITNYYENTGMLLFNSTEITILNNIVENTYDAIHLTSSNNCLIKDNHLSSNYYAIQMTSFSSNCSICRNNINSTKGVWGYRPYGIWLDQSSNNKIFHNNFFGDIIGGWNFYSMNTWDGSYPSGGNYWSDYNGTDLYSGPYQNETGSDGIGDTPYVIDENNIDRYPLMEPWLPPDVAVSNVTTSKNIVGRGYLLNVTIILANQGNKIENLSMTVYANETVIDFQTFLLRSGNSIIYTFVCNTTCLACGNHTITVYVEPISGETDTTDNTFTYDIITVTIPGDVDGDFDVDIYDVVKITCIYGYTISDPEFNPNCDLDDDGEITIYDVVRCTSHYGETYP